LFKDVRSNLARITVIGTGYVGSVAGACFADFGHQVICVDNDVERIRLLEKSVIPIFESGLDVRVERNVRAGRLQFGTNLADAVRKSKVIFIAVGTPLLKNHEVDLRQVEAAAREIARAMNGYKVIVNKSTAPMGTGRKIMEWVDEELRKRKAVMTFDVVANPEFLREGSAVFDFINPNRVVIGAEQRRALRIMREVYRPLLNNNVPLVKTSLESAEMIKYAANAFLATKVALVNEIAHLCEATGAHVCDVAEAVGLDGRIGADFLRPSPGYGGSCLPKDVKALAGIGRNQGRPLAVVEAAEKSNERHKMRVVDKIEQGLGGRGALSGKIIAGLGLTFKANTDDARESPAIAICKELVKRGAKVRVWDPAGMEVAARQLRSVKGIGLAADEYDAMAGAHAVVIFAPWERFLKLKLNKVRRTLAAPYFFDLHNIYEREKVESAGLYYFGIGT
jgi:UDPglucose 6-dehydrogenase